ncbi:uncharacterized protein LOC120748901 isoform X2 [Hirundo rustica]|uniref:uncharacterized protein LOC120748901 isoform X2 n=1 Tax=Hirundo rustica TaxID=43150 RepID=UPI001A94903E|nr:uncharacterized protein LOC120748901 isoform X2 [Hirundo rustica]
MERDEAVQEGLRRNNARFMASMNSILERYNHPFEDDLLVSMDTLTYDTPEGPKQWGSMSRKEVENWKKKIFKSNRRSQRTRGKAALRKGGPEEHSSDSEDEDSTGHQESSENTGVDSSDSGEERGDMGSVRRKLEDIRLQNQKADDGEGLKKKRVRVDVIVQDDERKIPKWITISAPRSSKDRRLTSAVQEQLEEHSSDSEDEDSTGHQESSENTGVDSSDSGEERGDMGSVRRKLEDIRLQNADNGEVLEKKRVRVDVIVQDDERKIPKWITISTPRSSKDRRLISPVQEQLGNQAPVCRKKLELSNECSSSKYLQLQHSGVPISSNAMASPRQQPCSGLSMTSCDSIHGEYQPADEGCSWSNTTLADLYPAMLETFTKLMAKRSQRKVLKHIFRYLRSKKRHSRRPKLSVTVDKMGESRVCKPKKAFHSTYSCRSEDNQNPAFGNESREFCEDSGLISNSSGLLPYAYTDTNEIRMGYSDSDLEQHLPSRKGQQVCKHAAFPDVMDRMDETFLVEDELQTTASPKNSECTESEKSAYERFSEPSFVTSAASSDSRVPYLVKERKTQKTDFCVGTSELCSCACSSHGNNNSSIPITNCSPARSSKTVFINPEKIIPERQTSFQHKDSFSSCFMKQSPSKMPDKYNDAFEELYYKVCSEKFQKSLTRSPLNSQNLEEKARLVKSNLSDFGRSIKQSDSKFDRLYEKLSVPGNRRGSVPNFPGFQTVSNFRKYEEIQMPETVNALVNSPVRTYSSIFRVKRAGNSENYLPCSPVKRLRLTPERCISSRKCQEISHSKKGNPQTADMDFLSTYNCSNPSLFVDHSCHCQGSGSHDSSDKSSLCIPGTSPQESRTAGARSRWPGAMENCSLPRNVRSHHPRVYRKLSYTEGKDQL